MLFSPTDTGSSSHRGSYFTPVTLKADRVALVEPVAYLRCSVRDLVLVDVGGVPQPEKQPVVAACSYYLIISRNPEAIASWHTLCTPNLSCLAVVHSELDVEPYLVAQSPILEFNLGLKAIAETKTLPDLLVEIFLQTLGE